MELFEAKPKHWGNSLGVTIPSNVIRKEGISTKKKVKFLVIGSGMDKVRDTFGSLKSSKPTQKIMEEIDEGYD